MLYPAPLGSNSGFKYTSILVFACSGNTNKYNNGTAVYRLCVKKVFEAGMSSISDLVSNEFKEYISNKNNWLEEDQQKRRRNEFEEKENERRRLLKQQMEELFNKEEKALKELEEIDQEYSRIIKENANKNNKKEESW